MSNLYQDAILDAKALRASAIANAKAALEEAFEPKIQEMLRAKLSEEEVQEIEEAEEIEEVKHGEEDIKEEVAVEESTEINEQELDEILAQLEELDQVEEAKHENLDEAKVEKVEEAKEEESEEAKEEEEGEEEEAEEGEEESEEAEAPEAEEVGDETKVIDITLGDLKQVLQSVMGAQAEAPAEEPTADSEAEAEISLDEILDELENEGAQDIGHYDAADVQAADLQHAEDFGLNEDQGVIQQILGQLSPEAIDNLKTVLLTGGGAAALISALKAAFPGVKSAMKGTSSVGPGPKGMEEAKHKKEEKEELKEAKATIETLRKDLQEVNLLNAKYLYMNKLFKSKSLTESQKVKVINALDRAASVAEVKNAYETLRESFETKKQTIKESIGFASKPAGMAPKANIVEADGFISRWQKLAGIKK